MTSVNQFWRRAKLPLAVSLASYARRARIRRQFQRW
jgi:hypothetical protein